jgi:hypothetical protein
MGLGGLINTLLIINNGGRMKYLFSTLLLAIATCSQAEVVSHNDVMISRINTYDDIENVAAYLYLSQNHADCPNGAYFNPNAPRFTPMYSLALAAFMAGKRVSLQLYNDRLHSGRCEIDAVSVFND